MAIPPIGTPFCSLTESELAGVDATCKWSFVDVAICQQLHLAGIDRGFVDRILSEIMADYNTNCGLSLRATGDPTHSNVYSQAGQIDGPMGVLGQSYLPCGMNDRTTTLQQVLDVAEDWAEQQFLKRVWLHELGHAMGLQHARIGAGCVMEPILTGFTALQPGDIAELQARYGPPVRRPPHPAPSPGEGEGDVFGGGILINIPKAGIYLFKVTMVER